MNCRFRNLTVRDIQNNSRSKLQKQLQIYLLTPLQKMPVGQCCQHR
jgi:hypothetical protein